MNLRRAGPYILAALIVAAVPVILQPAVGLAEPTGSVGLSLSFEVATDDADGRLALTPMIRNDTGQECLVAVDSSTSVVITALRRNNQAIEPQVSRVPTAQGLPTPVTNVAANTTARLATLSASHGALQTSSAGTGGASNRTVWDVSHPGHYVGTAVLANQAMAGSGVCATTRPTSVAFTVGIDHGTGFPIWQVTVIALTALLVGTGLLTRILRRYCPIVTPPWE